ncbi:MAG: PTS transporter subunit EIIC, partial [Deltaproteobacteria bacterium]|nr:PTS transporter subunit EIIC [Deltaproteobacteria bacterium]
MFKNFSLANFSVFMQQVGKSLMLPVAVLPVAGLFLGLGSANIIYGPVSQVMQAGGRVIFSNLALIFAIGVTLGFTKNDGTAALSAAVGYLVMVATMSAVAVHFLGRNPAAEAKELQMVIGLMSVDTGVFGGILIGGVSAFLFNRFY